MVEVGQSRFLAQHGIHKASKQPYLLAVNEPAVVYWRARSPANEQVTSDQPAAFPAHDKQLAAVKTSG
jgi:hypothetical protein